MKILLTGGAGFIGSNLVRRIINTTNHHVLNLDKLTYAGNLSSLRDIASNPRYSFIKGDICDQSFLKGLFSEFKPDAVMHLAAESHVDRSIDSPSAFIETNILGTHFLLETSLDFWRRTANDNFRFLHISTDEVFGSLGETGLFNEETPYQPNSPYSASKASSDHLVRAWHHTYGLPTLTTNCSNNYGPYQFPEKLIPLMILNALEDKPLPIYGDGLNIRDWLYVEDHADALITVLQKGRVGETYNIGGNAELTNKDVVYLLCEILDSVLQRSPSRRTLINYVKDRPGHDRRYAMDIQKINKELGWAPKETFASGIKKTLDWYLDNRKWWEAIRNGNYRGERLGLKEGFYE